MMAEKRWFPYKEIDDREVQYINNLCGGEPLERPEYVDGFLQTSAVPLLRASALSYVLPAAAKDCYDALNIDPPLGSHAFNQGALFYAGVLAELSPLTAVPCEQGVLMDLADTEDYIFTSETYERAWSEIPSFCRLMENAWQALEISENSLRQLAIVGAGLVHIVTVESLMLQEVNLFEEEHPELADIEDLFRNLPGE